MLILTSIGICLFTDEPQLMIDGGEHVAWAEQSRTFVCSAKGVPEPTITWFRHSNFLRDNNATYQVEGRLGTSKLKVSTMILHQAKCAFCLNLTYEALTTKT